MSSDVNTALIANQGYVCNSSKIDERAARQSIDRLTKIAIDLVLASAVILLALPVFIVIALAVKCDGGPIFYRHLRVGRGGRLFHCYKFRSMQIHGDTLLESLLKCDPVEAAAWARNRKLVKDPRVTFVGKILRKTSLDEIPQLLNVLRLEMSLVGPRPIVEQEIHLYGVSVSKYYACRPGITGLWQVSGRSNTSFSERVAYDAAYAQNWSLLGDLKILARTVPAVLSGLGAR